MNIFFYKKNKTNYDNKTAEIIIRNIVSRLQSTLTNLPELAQIEHEQIEQCFFGVIELV